MCAPVKLGIYDSTQRFGMSCFLDDSIVNSYFNVFSTYNLSLDPNIISSVWVWATFKLNLLAFRRQLKLLIVPGNKACLSSANVLADIEMFVSSANILGSGPQAAGEKII